MFVLFWFVLCFMNQTPSKWQSNQRTLVISKEAMGNSWYILYTILLIRSLIGSGDSSVVRAPDPAIERPRVRIPAGAAGEFSSPGSTFCANSYFGIRSTPVLPQ